MADSDVWQEAVKGVRRLRTNRHTDDIEPKEIKIRKDIKNERVESAKRCADFKRRMNQWEELKKKDYRR